MAYTNTYPLILYIIILNLSSVLENFLYLDNKKIKYKNKPGLRRVGFIQNLHSLQSFQVRLILDSKFPLPICKSQEPFRVQYQKAQHG